MNDMEIARGTTDGDNLAIGEPYLVERELQLRSLPYPYPSRYPSSVGEEGLLDELRPYYAGRHVVVANGAKQALLAAFYAYWALGRVNAVYHEPPYWPSYPTLAKLSGLDFKSTDLVPDFKTDLHCITSPNNPDGRQITEEQACDIWDAAYASPIYNWNGVAPDATTIVTSMSKLFGLPGMRVGWLATKSAGVAHYAAQYVEITTSGVCTMAQESAAGVLRWVRDNPDHMRQRAEVASRLIQANGATFNAMLSPYCSFTSGVPSDGNGMFAWFKLLDDFAEVFPTALKRAGVTLVSGKACGVDVPGFWRMNMALDNQVTAAALARIVEALQAGGL